VKDNDFRNYINANAQQQASDQQSNAIINVAF